jgi:hypothetical protein
VTDFLRWVHADLLELKPGLVTSIAVLSERMDPMVPSGMNGGGIVCCALQPIGRRNIFEKILEDIPIILATRAAATPASMVNLVRVQAARAMDGLLVRL